MLDLNTVSSELNKGCPLRITHCSWSDPNLSFGGENWNISLDTFWRVHGSGKIRLGYADEESDQYFQSLVGVDILAMRAIGGERALDFELSLSNGDILSVFSLFRSENFVIRLKDSVVFVFIPD